MIIFWKPHPLVHVQIYPFSLVKALFRKLIPFVENGRPKFYFCDKGTPEEVTFSLLLHMSITRR